MLKRPPAKRAWEGTAEAGPEPGSNPECAGTCGRGCACGADADFVIDFKSTASKPSPDPLLDPLDLQKLALTRAWETATGRTVASWRWAHLVKTKTPSLVDVDLPVAIEHRGADLARLAAVVNPTIRAMDAVLSGALDPVPTQAPRSLCGSCGFRNACVLWALPRDAAPAP